MAVSRTQRQQPVDHVQAGLVSSLTSLFSQKINSTEELKKVPVVKPTPRRNPQSQRQTDNSPSHLGFTQVGKPALIQLVQAPHQHQHQKYQYHQQHQQHQQGPNATEEWTVYETLPIAPDSQHSQRQSYVTKKTKYSSRSALGGDQADVAAASTFTTATATNAAAISTAPVLSAATSAAADKYRLEEWIVYETLPVDMGGAATAATKDDRLERIHRQEAEQRRLKAEFEEKRASRRQMEAARMKTSRATPEMFTKEEWTVYETVPAVVRRSASSGRESRTVQKQQHQHQQHQHQHQMRQMRSESSDSAIGYRRYLDESYSTHQGVAENATRGTKNATMAATTKTKTVNAVQRDARTRRVDTPEVFSKEEWTVYETVPSAAAHESQYHQSEKQQQQRRSVRWSSVADPQQLQVATARKTPEVYSKEEWTVFETVPSTAVQPTQSERYQLRQQQHQHRETLHRSPSEESVLGYRRYLDQPAIESTSKSITKRSSYQIGGSSSKFTETRREERRQPPPQSSRRLPSPPPPPPLSQSAARYDIGRSSTPIRTEEWTVVHRVPIEEESRWLETGGRRVAKETVWRQQTSGSPAGYKRYVIGSTGSLTGDDIVDSRLDDIPDYYFYSYENGRKMKQLRELWSPPNSDLSAQRASVSTGY